MERRLDISDLADLEEAAKGVLKDASLADASRAAVLALHGDLGAGKTTFVQMLGRELDIEESITSPTFVIMKKYPVIHPRFSALVHIDAYRLEAPAELSVLDFAAELADPANLICVEWAEKAADLLPSYATHLYFGLQGGRRALEIK